MRSGLRWVGWSAYSFSLDCLILLFLCWIENGRKAFRFCLPFDRKIVSQIRTCPSLVRKTPFYVLLEASFHTLCYQTEGELLSLLAFATSLISISYQKLSIDESTPHSSYHNVLIHITLTTPSHTHTHHWPRFGGS